MQDALELSEQLTELDDNAEVMIIGGAQIFVLTLPLAQRIYLTQLHAKVAGDTYFPEFPAEHWRLAAREDHPAEGANPYAYSFLVLEKRT